MNQRYIDSGWRLTIPKTIRESLGWDKDTLVCVSWDGASIIIKEPINCVDCPYVKRMGALGKVVIPPRVREEACLYRGQIMSISVQDGLILARPADPQVRCQACGSEMDVRRVLPNVYLCSRCRDSLETAVSRGQAQR